MIADCLQLQQCGLVIAYLSLISTIAYILLAASPLVGTGRFGLFLAAIGAFPLIAKNGGLKNQSVVWGFNDYVMASSLKL